MHKGRYRPRSDGLPPANPSLYRHKPRKGRYRGGNYLTMDKLVRMQRYWKRRYA